MLGEPSKRRLTRESAGVNSILRQFTQGFISPAMVVCALAVVAVAMNGILPVQAGAALSLQTQNALSIDGPARVDFPENSDAVIATYRATNAPDGASLSWSVDGVDRRRFAIDSDGALRFKAARNFESPNDGNRDNGYEIDVSLSAGSSSASIEVTVTVTDVNEAPAFDLQSATFSVTENAGPNKQVGGALAVSDPDEGDTAAFSLSGTAASLFLIDAQGQIRVGQGAALDYETTASYALTARVTDSGDLEDTLSVTINLRDADDPGIVIFSSAKPFVGASFGATVTDDDGVDGRKRWRWHRAKGADDEFQRIDGATGSSYTPVEGDVGYLLQVSVTYTDNFQSQASASAISVAVSKNGAPTFSAASVSLSVVGKAAATTAIGAPITATDPDGDTLMYSLSGTDASYFSINQSTGQIAVGSQALPDVATKNSYTVTVTATDPGGLSASITVTITARAANRPPTITGSAAVNYAENGSTAVASYTADDPDDDDITWSVTGTDAALFSISTAGSLSFMASPNYENPGDSDAVNAYAVAVSASDGALSATLDVVITVTDVNEAPTVAGAASVSYVENGTGAVASYTADDPEGDDMTWSVTGTDASLFAVSVAGALSFTSPPDYENPADSDEDNVYDVTVQARDGSLTGEQGVTVTVTDALDKISISGSATVSYAENGAAAIAAYSVAEVDASTVAWSVTGVDAAKVSINASGSLLFASSPDYEDPQDADTDNIYAVTVNAASGQLTATRDVEITVTDVNETPAIAGSAAITYSENATSAVSTYTASDPDGDDVTWSVSGTDVRRFAIDAKGRLTFKVSPNFESPRDANKDNVYEVDVTASDGSLAVTLNIEVTVQDVNEAPAIGGSATVSFAENGTDSVAIYSATDPEGDTITWSLSGSDAELFSISATAALSFKSSPDHENAKDDDEDNVYEVTVSASDGTLTSDLAVEITVTNVTEASTIVGPTAVSYAENATEAIGLYTTANWEGGTITWGLGGVDEARFSINGAGTVSFKSPPDYEKPRDANKDNVYKLTVSVTDGSITATLDVDITVTDVNEPAAITGPASSAYAENATTTISSYSATDPDGDTVTWSVTGTDADHFDISAAANLSFVAPPDYENPSDANTDNAYRVTVRAFDGSLATTLDVVVTVTNVNEAAAISGPVAVIYQENMTSPVAAFTAADPDGDTISWSVSGADAGALEISAAGALSFKASPDYESAGDANTDNVYMVSVAAWDGGLTASLDVSITVANVNEAASITGPNVIGYPENSGGDVAAYSAVDPDGDEVTWSLTGQDAGSFMISGSGLLRFRSPPDHETPTDSNADNSYDVSVSVSDGSLTTTVRAAVAVTNVNESAPVIGIPSVTYAENGAAIVAAYSIADPEGDDIVWSISGRDAPSFEVSVAGELQFAAPPNYENPLDLGQDNVYEVIVEGSDGSLTSSLDVRITVQNVDEAAVVTGPSVATLQENDGGNVAEYALIDPDDNAEVSAEWVVAGSDAAHLAIDDDRKLAFVAAPNFENPADADKDNIYRVRVVARHGNDESDTEVSIQVTNVNDAPRFPSHEAEGDVPENSCPGGHTIYRGIGGDESPDLDEDGDPLTYALSGEYAQFFVIHPPTGYVTLGPGFPLNFEGDDTTFMLRVSVADGRDDQGNDEQEPQPDAFMDLRVTVTDVDEPPVFVGTQAIVDACGRVVRYDPVELRRSVSAHVPGGTTVGAPIAAIDPEGKSVQYSIVSETEPGAFTLDRDTGQIRTASDFVPRDARRVYRLRVAADDGALISETEVRIAINVAPRPRLTPDNTDRDDGLDEESDGREDDADSDSDDTDPDSADVTEREDEADAGDDAAESIDDADDALAGLLGLTFLQPVFAAPNDAPVDFTPVERAAQSAPLGNAESHDTSGRFRLTAPPGTLAVPYQVRLTEVDAGCAAVDEQREEESGLLGCLSVAVEFFDAAGSTLTGEHLNRPALLEILLHEANTLKLPVQAQQYPIVDQTALIGANYDVEALMRETPDDDWQRTLATLREPGDGSVILTVQVITPGQYVAVMREQEQRADSGVETAAAPPSAPSVTIARISEGADVSDAPGVSGPEPAAISFETPSPVTAPPPLFIDPATIVAPNMPVVGEPSTSWALPNLRSWSLSGIRPPNVSGLMIALLLDVSVALSAGFLLQRITLYRR